MKTNEKMMNMTRILARVNDGRSGKNLPMLEYKVYHKGFEPFISFLSIT